MRIVCISDTHAFHDIMPAIPDGDVLVHGGDITGRGELDTVRSFNRFLGDLPHKHKIVIAGNHDFCFEREPKEAEPLLTNAVYLKNSEHIIDGVKFYGSPYQPWFHDWAFNLRTEASLRACWQQIPFDVNVLITHGPPYKILDKVYNNWNPDPNVGCKVLREMIDDGSFPLLQLHVFGHIHEAYGQKEHNGIQFVNASCCNLDYEPVLKPIIIDL